MDSKKKTTKTTKKNVAPVEDVAVVEEEQPNTLFLYGCEEEDAKTVEEDRDDMLIAYDTHPENSDEILLGYDMDPEHVSELTANYTPTVSQYADSPKKERPQNKQQMAQQAKAAREKWVEKGRNARVKKFSKH